MPVIPYCHHLFQSHRDLYQFLSAYKQSCIDKKHSQIISISQEIDPVDPLVFYHQFASSHALSFYSEKRENHYYANGNGHTASLTTPNSTRIAALGSSTSVRLEGRDRFKLAKEFIQKTLENTVIVGDTHAFLAGPHFFCGFSFFDENSDSNNPFAAATVFLPTWQVSCSQNRSSLVINLLIHAEAHLDVIVDDVWKILQAIRSTTYEWRYFGSDGQNLTTQNVTDTRHFMEAVQSALQSIRSGLLNKIVLAHAVDISSPLPFRLVFSLHNLRRLYPDCYIFALSNGQQHFIGASPERLISLRDRHLLTDALAGSAPRGKTTREDAYLANLLLNSGKELHEHRVVLEFITQHLCQLGLSPQTSPLHLRQLSNIQHLQTPIRATVPAHIHLLDAVAELHPTPAVAGMPRDIACEYIRRYEGFERSLYAAPIGWVDHQGNGEFAVGIRSALIEGRRARLYAGAGIVAGSTPERELAEVHLKLQALLAALV